MKVISFKNPVLGILVFQFLLQISFAAGFPFKEISTKAMKGETLAQANLGTYYYQMGEWETAAKWLEKAAKKGNIRSMYNYSLLLYTGRGVEKADLKESFSYVKKAAEADHLEAKFSYAMMLARGQGTTRNTSEAIRFLKKAAYEKHFQARVRLARFYKKKKDLPKTHAWYYLASLLNSEEAKLIAQDLEKEMKPEEIKESKRIRTGDFRGCFFGDPPDEVKKRVTDKLYSEDSRGDHRVFNYKDSFLDEELMISFEFEKEKFSRVSMRGGYTEPEAMFDRLKEKLTKNYGEGKVGNSGESVERSHVFLLEGLYQGLQAKLQIIKKNEFMGMSFSRGVLLEISPEKK